MPFRLGRPILAMSLIALATGAALLRRPALPPADLRVWVFAEAHARSYRDPIPSGADEGSVLPSLIALHQRQTGLRTDVQLISARALDIRLISLFNTDSRDVPDLVEIEIGSAGKYFRPPLPDIGLLPLNAFLRRDGLLHLENDGPVDLRASHPADAMVRARFAPWSREGWIFGIPHDLHPVTLTYRKDLFDAAGIDLSAATTWDEFHAKCLQFQDFWKARGIAGRYAVELPATASDCLLVMLLQRGINVIDDHLQVYLEDPRVVDTLARYAQMAAGPRRVGADAMPGGELWARDFAQGHLCALITADWRAGYLPLRAPELKGKVAMMPLPRFDPVDAPTGTWGGTMIGIPRNCRDPEAAWQLLRRLYLSPEGLRARQRFTRILPPIKAQWTDPLYRQPDPYFGGQRVDELYIDLAPRIPARYVTAYSLAASVALSVALSDARAYVEEHSGEAPSVLDAGLRAHCTLRLKALAGDLRKRIAFGTSP